MGKIESEQPLGGEGEMGVVKFPTALTFVAFKAKYHAAKMNGDDVFTFQNQEVFVKFAAYMIEHIEYALTNDLDEYEVENEDGKFQTKFGPRKGEDDE